mgnify:CR=1 FL=1
MTTLYNNFKKLLFDGAIDLGNDDIQLALIDDSISYTPDIDNEVYVSDVLDDVTASECSGAGYSRVSISQTTSIDTVDDEAVLDASDLTYTEADFGTIQSLLLFKNGSTDSDSPVIANITSTDLPLTTNGGDVDLNWATEGVLNIG